MSTADFYDRMAELYHLIFEDWEASIHRQGEALDAIIRENWPAKVQRVLDATCGIGTQSIGLAQAGYEVTASDLSAASVARARREADTRRLSIDLNVCDVRELSQQFDRPFDLVVSCDNSLPHLPDETEIATALAQMYACTRPGGGCLVSVRDYAREDCRGVQVRPYGVRQWQGRRFVVLQVWEGDGDRYSLTMYFIEDTGENHCATHVMRSSYLAIPVERLADLMRRAGYDRVSRIEGRFYQPVLVGTRPLE